MELEQGRSFPENWDGFLKDGLFENDSDQFKIINVSDTYKQVLSHQNIHAVFVEIELQTVPKGLQSGYLQLNRKKIKEKVAVPRIIDRYLSENVGYLRLL